jgi:hypothetical protein
MTQTFNYTANIFPTGNENISSWSAYINNNYYGDDVSEIQINTGDVLKIEIVKYNAGQPSTLTTRATLI